MPRPKQTTSPPEIRPARRRDRSGHELGEGRTDLRPIGKARLKALREAIRNGTYPTAESVEQGLLRMFTRPATRRPRS